MDNKTKVQDKNIKNKAADNNKDGSFSQKMIRRGLTIAVTIFATLLIVSIVLIFIVSNKIDSMAGADAQIKLSAQGGFSCEYSEAQKLYPYGDGVIKVTSERIAYLTLSGSEVFSHTVSYQNPQCVVFDDYVAVFDRDGYSFTVLDQNGVWYSKPTANPVKAVSMSKAGFIAVISGNDESYGEVSIFDQKGNELAVWTSYNSGFPICCAFNNDSSKSLSPDGCDIKHFSKCPSRLTTNTIVASCSKDFVGGYQFALILRLVCDIYCSISLL